MHFASIQQPTIIIISESFSTKVQTQNAKNEKFSHIVFKLSSRWAIQARSLFRHCPRRAVRGDCPEPILDQLFQNHRVPASH